MAVTDAPRAVGKVHDRQARTRPASPVNKQGTLLGIALEVGDHSVTNKLNKLHINKETMCRTNKSMDQPIHSRAGRTRGNNGGRTMAKHTITITETREVSRDAESTGQIKREQGNKEGRVRRARDSSSLNRLVLVVSGNGNGGNSNSNSSSAISSSSSSK
jgi:hypothetical protein